MPIGWYRFRWVWNPLPIIQIPSKSLRNRDEKITIDSTEMDKSDGESFLDCIWVVAA